MSYSYLFHLPTRLPLAAADFGPDYAANMPTTAFPDRDVLRRDISALFPNVKWDGNSGKAESDAGWVEPHIFEHEGTYWSLRCSLRSDYAAVVQSICDRTGWVAFDEGARLFQPHREPFHLE